MCQAILGIVDKVLGLFKTKQDREAAKEKVINEAPFIKAKENQEAAKRTDENEELVAAVDGSGSLSDRIAMDEIRKRLGK